MPMTRVGPRQGARRDARLHEGPPSTPKSQRILGAALLRIEGDEIVHSILDVMAAEASYKVIERAVHLTDGERADPDVAGKLEPLNDAPKAR